MDGIHEFYTTDKMVIITGHINLYMHLSLKQQFTEKFVCESEKKYSSKSSEADASGFRKEKFGLRDEV